MNGVARLSAEERADLFTEAAARKGVRAIIAEKDFWVCWTLSRVFGLRSDQPGLIFKGGTSLAKVFGVIQRFSEDIVLSLNRDDLGFTGDRDPERAPSRNAAQRLIEALEHECVRHIADVLLPALKDDFAGVLDTTNAVANDWGLVIDDDHAQTVNFVYPPGLLRSEYDAGTVQPMVRIELGARSDHWPAAQYSVTPYTAEVFPEQFQTRSCEVKTLEAERTFWEKATLLHAEYHRPTSSVPRRDRSRHYYDLAMLARSEIKQRALASRRLLERVVKHKNVFFRRAWASYDTAVGGRLHLVPHAELEKTLRSEYSALQEMIFQDPPGFDSVLSDLSSLEKEINAVVE